jgi:hypothetical protein
LDKHLCYIHIYKRTNDHASVFYAIQEKNLGLWYASLTGDVHFLCRLNYICAFNNPSIYDHVHYNRGSSYGLALYPRLLVPLIKRLANCYSTLLLGQSCMLCQFIAG